MPRRASMRPCKRTGTGSTMDLTLKVWRQAGPESAGRFETYDAPGMSPDMSFLELLDVVNEDLLAKREERGVHEVTVEPWRAAAFPIIKDLCVDRSAFDRIVEAGGYITAPTGSAPDANLIPIPKEAADTSMDAAACIGCGACVAACPN